MRNAGLKTTKDAIVALNAGRVFYYKGYRLYKSDGYLFNGKSPYRRERMGFLGAPELVRGITKGVWNHVDLWTEELPWFEGVAFTQGILCWARYEIDSIPKLVNITSYIEDSGFPFRTVIGQDTLLFKYAVPATKEEVLRHVFGCRAGDTV